MKIEILYQTQYAYAEPVSLSSHLYRLFPKADRDIVVRKVDFQTNIGAVIGFRRDLFDNEVASVFYPGKTALLGATLRLELEISEKNAFGFLLDTYALNLPFSYKPEEQAVLAPYCSSAAPIDLPFWKPPISPQPTVSVLVELNSAIHEHFAYERRDEGEARTPAETLALGSGACRDFSLLMAEVLRGMGLAARLASGYLCEFGEGERRAEGALHAWIETYLPGAGWVGFDPTNGTLCNHNHITAAVGLTPADISPVLGRYFHDTHVPAQMHASLYLNEIV
ncbi:MAG: Transglutaminase domain protein [Chthoniobacteraceae bacterium]|nr:Transglutaminase domain protein [Chthoniobacteraceae bacterium]